jgi:hypothetical protein
MVKPLHMESGDMDLTHRNVTCAAADWHTGSGMFRNSVVTDGGGTTGISLSRIKQFGHTTCEHKIKEAYRDSKNEIQGLRQEGQSGRK